MMTQVSLSTQGVYTTELGHTKDTKRAKRVTDEAHAHGAGTSDHYSGVLVPP